MLVTRPRPAPLCALRRRVARVLVALALALTATTASAAEPAPASVFEMPPAHRLDPYGPRPAGVPALTREQIIRYGLENPYIKAAEAEVEAMQQLLLKAKFAWVPAVRTTLAIAPGANIECNDVPVQRGDGGTETFQVCRPPGGIDLYSITGYFEQLPRAGVMVRFDFDLVIPLYTFGKIKHLKGMAEAGLSLRRLERERVRQETVLRVYQAHATLVLARETAALLQQAWTIVGDARKVIDKDMGIGEDGEEDEDAINEDRDPADRTRLELIELELESRMLQAREIEATSLAALWAIAGQAAPQGFDIAEQYLVLDDVDGGLQESAHYQQQALRERPEARMAAANVELRRAAEKLERSRFLPDLGILINGRFQYMSNADKPTELYYSPYYNYNLLTVLLGLRWTLDFHNYTWNLRKARAERRSAEYTEDAAALLLKLEVERAYQKLHRARRDVDLTERASKKARQLVVAQQMAETVGGGDFEKLGKALKDWAEWRFRHFQAMYTHNVAIAELSRAVGAPLASPQKGPE
ncbi:MAG: TolC family protein [Myxococcales bacterium]|nr:TolC family protein [Myxococcales bacterium]